LLSDPTYTVDPSEERAGEDCTQAPVANLHISVPSDDFNAKTLYSLPTYTVAPSEERTGEVYTSEPPAKLHLTVPSDVFNA